MLSPNATNKTAALAAVLFLPHAGISSLVQPQGERLGEPTTFDFGFFANSKVMALEAQPLTAPLANDQAFKLRKR